MDDRQSTPIQNGDILTEYFNCVPIAKYIVTDQNAVLITMCVIWYDNEPLRIFGRSRQRDIGVLLTHSRRIIEDYLTDLELADHFVMSWTIEKIK
jgi:hypothetical protein